METTREEIIREIEVLAGVDASLLFDKGLLTLEHARKWIVYQKYFQLKEPRRTFTDIKYELSIEYGLSVSAIEKLVYRRSEL
jgi:hypothetical protein